MPGLVESSSATGSGLGSELELMAFAGHNYVDEYADDAIILSVSDPREDGQSRSRGEDDGCEESVQQAPPEPPALTGLDFKKARRAREEHLEV